MFCVMKKMMVLTLALSVMMVGNAMAMSNAEVDMRGPERVKINVSIGGKHDGRYADVLHMVFCPECRAHLKHGCAVCDHHRPHPKPHHNMHRGDGKHHPSHRYDGGHRGDDNKHRGDKGHGSGNDRGHGRR